MVEDHVVGNLLWFLSFRFQFWIVCVVPLHKFIFIVAYEGKPLHGRRAGTFCLISRLAISNWFCEGSLVQVCE